MLLKSFDDYIQEYKLIVYTNFDIKLDNKNVEIRKYYDKTITKIYNNDWLNMSFNKINVYKDLYDEFKENFVWIDLDTIITYDITYVNDLDNCFIENGGDCITDNPLFSNNTSICIKRNKYIQGNFWKINIDLYNDLIKTLNELTGKGLKLRYDLQDLFGYYIYIKNNGELKNINIIGSNIQENSINGLCIWSKNGNTHATLDGLKKLYYDGNVLRSSIYPNKEIHILSFTFDTLKKLWDTEDFNLLFNKSKSSNSSNSSKDIIGVFGTCRIDKFNIHNLQQKSKTYPYIYENNNYKINVRPLGYTTSSSDVLQNLRLLKDNKHTEIMNDPFIYKNVFLKHGGQTIITDLNYKYIVLEICSIKKIIHKQSGLIFPYEIEGHHNKDDFRIECETETETISNIVEISNLMNCPIILLPPITNFKGNPIKGVHENTIPEHVLSYRNNIIDRLKIVSKNNSNITLLNWNDDIKEHGINKMLLDQFHFTDFGKNMVANIIFNFIMKNPIKFVNEDLIINIPYNNNKLHRYYQMFEERDNCEVLFRLFIKYCYEHDLIDKSKNIIDLGAWIGDNTIPWAMRISGNVYAIDPSIENINYIKELCRLNNIHNVFPIQKCISNTVETVYANGDIKHTEFNVKSGSIKMTTTTLDILNSDNIINNIGFIHLDVEGFEQKILNGTVNLINKHKPIIVWENHLTMDNYKSIVLFFNTLNYKSFLINERFPNCRPDCRNFLSFPNDNNMFNEINNINNYFSDSKYNIFKADINKPFLIGI
jgi:FkbM family methyltransferase